ncbi:hypothetical protein QOZ80_3AG0226480 [Eleusine coracana subsp. coracana]|nr:hypothetical protein QOZ80_3AG0226480 [Eleusine coracana subsp. coracana]
MTMSPSFTRLRAAALLLLPLVAAASWLQACDAAPGFYAGKCGMRCGCTAKARARGACMRTYTTRKLRVCFEQCNCVPTSARGGIIECPCYRNMLTAGPKKRPKCP